VTIKKWIIPNGMADERNFYYRSILRKDVWNIWKEYRCILIGFYIPWKTTFWSSLLRVESFSRFSWSLETFTNSRSLTVRRIYDWFSYNLTVKCVCLIEWHFLWVILVDQTTSTPQRERLNERDMSIVSLYNQTAVLVLRHRPKSSTCSGAEIDVYPLNRYCCLSQ